jgi:hypothetical protein
MQLTLAVRMISNSGSIPAGGVKFNPFLKAPLERTDYSGGLDKCPDRLATISFRHSYQFLKIDEHLKIASTNTGHQDNSRLLKYSKSSEYIKGLSYRNPGNISKYILLYPERTSITLCTQKEVALFFLPSSKAFRLLSISTPSRNQGFEEKATMSMRSSIRIKVE